MLGAYFSASMNTMGHFGLSVLLGAIGVSIVGLMFEEGY